MNCPSPVSHPAAPQLFRGVLGGGADRPGKANLRLIRRAVRAGWLDAAPQAVRDALMEHCCAVAVAGNARNAVAAAWCVVEADRANLPEADRADG